MQYLTDSHGNFKANDHSIKANMLTVVMFRNAVQPLKPVTTVRFDRQVSICHGTGHVVPQHGNAATVSERNPYHKYRT